MPDAITSKVFLIPERIEYMLKIYTAYLEYYRVLLTLICF